MRSPCALTPPRSFASGGVAQDMDVRRQQADWDGAHCWPVITSIAYTTASSQQLLYGLNLTGWTSNTKLKAINVTINETSGSVTTDDFATAGTNSTTSGIGLYDSNKAGLTLTAAPALVIGSSFSIYPSSQTLATAERTSGNYNYYVSVKTSSTISDAIPDSFKLTVDSVVITTEL